MSSEITIVKIKIPVDASTAIPHNTYISCKQQLIEESFNTKALQAQKDLEMDKGIRAFARTYFAAQNALRVDPASELYKGPKGNTAFRKEVMSKLMTEFDVTLASAATHYNEALITVRKATPEAVLGLGRPDDKKGGRKKKEDAAPAAELPAITVGDVSDSNVLPSLELGALEAPAANDAVQELAVA